MSTRHGKCIVHHGPLGTIDVKAPGLDFLKTFLPIFDSLDAPPIAKFV
jgi:hypothetical protein